MTIKNHSGVVSTFRTWNNAYDELEILLYSDEGFLWHFAEDKNKDTLEEERFYAPVYDRKKYGRKETQTSHLFYILNPEDEYGDTVFIEIGPDGFLNPTHQPAKTMRGDVEKRNLLPMWRVSSFGKPPEETIGLLSKLQ